jgi:hypothetical protein
MPDQLPYVGQAPCTVVAIKDRVSQQEDPGSGPCLAIQLMQYLINIVQ